MEEILYNYHEDFKYLDEDCSLELAQLRKSGTRELQKIINAKNKCESTVASVLEVLTLLEESKDCLKSLVQSVSTQDKIILPRKMQNQTVCNVKKVYGSIPELEKRIETLAVETVSDMVRNSSNDVRKGQDVLVQVQPNKTMY